jgi:divalent metal cation (Fe/Co/Zn/Cd) transporter
MSHSDALLVDGLYSGINFVSAMVAARISIIAYRPTDRRYPLGYDAHETLYVTFRSLTLLGILLFAATGAVGKIITDATGGEVPQLVFGPISVYVVLMMAVCLLLALWHRRNWRRSGKQSELLRIESRAALVDGVISGGAGAGLLAAGLLPWPLSCRCPMPSSSLSCAPSPCCFLFGTS